jgi:hypothetical protein
LSSVFFEIYCIVKLDLLLNRFVEVFRKKLIVRVIELKMRFQNKFIQTILILCIILFNSELFTRIYQIGVICFDIKSKLNLLGIVLTNHSRIIKWNTKRFFQSQIIKLLFLDFWKMFISTKFINLLNLLILHSIIFQICDLRGHCHLCPSNQIIIIILGRVFDRDHKSILIDKNWVIDTPLLQVIRNVVVLEQEQLEAGLEQQGK